MSNNLEVIETIFENDLQRILKCRNNTNGDIFLNNIIFNANLIKLINVAVLNDLKSNIEAAYKDDDRLYIISKLAENDYQHKIKDYVKKGLTLKQQFCLAEQLINLAIDIDTCSDLLQFKIMNEEHLTVDNYCNLKVNGDFEFTNEFDISDNFTFKNLGNILHYIFSSEEISDYNLSDNVPPEIRKIIVGCLVRDYNNPRDIMRDFKDSSIYSIVNCNNKDKYETVHTGVKPKVSDNSDLQVNEDSDIVVDNMENSDEESKNDAANLAVGVSAGIAVGAAVIDKDNNLELDDNQDEADIENDFSDEEVNERNNSENEKVTDDENQIEEIEENSITDVNSDEAAEENTSVSDDEVVSDDLTKSDDAETYSFQEDDIEYQSKGEDLKSEVSQDKNEFEYEEDAEEIRIDDENIDRDENNENEVNSETENDENFATAAFMGAENKDLTSDDDFDDFHMNDTDGVIDEEKTAEPLENIIDIYLSEKKDYVDENANDEEEKSNAKHILLPIFVVVFVVILSIFIIKSLYSDKNNDLNSGDDSTTEAVDNGNVTSGNSDDTNAGEDSTGEDSQNTDGENTDSDSSASDSTSVDEEKYKNVFDKSIIESLEYEGATAKFEVVEGKTYLVAENNTEDKLKVLFTVLDFNGDNSYMKGKQIEIIMKLLANKDATVGLEVMANGKISSSKLANIEVLDSSWSTKTISIDVKDMDSIMLFLNLEKGQKIWIDQISVNMAK